MSTEATSAASPQASPAPEAPSASIASFEERAAAVFANDGEPAGDAAPEAVAEPAQDEASAKRAERRKALAEALAQERARVDAVSRQRQADEALKRAEAIERERAALEQQLSSRIDPSSLDEAGFFELAEKLNITPKKLGEWLQTQTMHPERIAAEAAKKQLDPTISKLAKELEETRAQIRKLESQRQEEAAREAAYARGESIVSTVKQSASHSPLANQYLQTYGEDAFLELANSVYPGEVANWQQHTIDAVEEQLATFMEYANRLNTKPTPAAGSTPTPSIQGKAKQMTTTISNSLAQSRASVVDEDTDWSRLPYEERAKRVFG